MHGPMSALPPYPCFGEPVLMPVSWPMQAMSPLTVTAWRFLIAAALMLLLLFVKEKPSWSTVHSSIWVYIVLGVVGVFVTNALQFTALKYTPPLHPALIMATNPIVTAFLAVPLLKENIRKGQIIGMLCSIAGVLMVITMVYWDGSF
ncbi:hypothetical protein CPT76_08830 [Paenibacillus sp. AR247]|nr:hypothetical protein CPT76_08830 [Paenibacillus sp. AR247]